MSEPHHDAPAEANEVSATEEREVGGVGFDAGRPDESVSNSGSVDANKLQRAIDNLVNRIAEARSLGAARDRTGELQARLDDIESTAGHGDAPGQAPVNSDNEEGKAGTQPQASSSEHYVSALELRMKQIADLAGPHSTEHLSSEIAALRGKIDRLSRLDGVLTGRMETFQQQMSELRAALDTSSVPVVDRLAELEARLDEIGEALASRRLTGEARAAVEHSCSHILGAIARIEDVARQAAVPKGTWDHIAATRDALARIPTVDDIAVLEKRILEISGKLVEVAGHGNLSDELTGLETRLTDVVAATKFAVDEIRERPALDHTKIRDEVHTLLKQTEAQIGNRLSSESGVDVKIDAIARKVDRLTQAENIGGLSKIQNGLSDLAGIVSAQSTHLSRLDLVGLQHRLARICDKLAAAEGEVFESSEPPATTFAFTDYGHAPEDDEDRESAKQLAIRLAPNSPAAKAPRHDEQMAAEPAPEDVSGAFAAVRDALEALLGQVPYVEPSSTDDRTSTIAPGSERSPAPERTMPRSDELAAPASAGPYRQFDEFAKQNVDRTNEPKPSEQGTGAAVADSSLDRDGSRETASKLVRQARDAPADSSGSDEGEASTNRLKSDSDAANLKLVPSTENKEQSGYGGAVDSFGTFSTWRKAKVAIVNANTPKD